jgi:hypothetical protein
MKVAVDQTVWSVLWNSCYYVLLGLFKFESPAVIASTVRNSWWDLLKAGWRLWPFVHFFTYSVIPVQHRLLFVDAVELVSRRRVACAARREGGPAREQRRPCCRPPQLWVSILSTYGQEQRRKMLAETPDAPPQVACALPGTDGEGGDAAEEILRALTVRPAGVRCAPVRSPGVPWCSQLSARPAAAARRWSTRSCWRTGTGTAPC